MTDGEIKPIGVKRGFSPLFLLTGIEPAKRSRTIPSGSISRFGLTGSS